MSPGLFLKALPSIALVLLIAYDLSSDGGDEASFSYPAQRQEDARSPLPQEKGETFQVRAGLFERAVAASVQQPGTSAPAAAGDGKPRFRVTGIVVRRSASLATVELSDSRGALRVKESDIVDGWTVTQIMDRALLVSQRGKSVQLLLDPALE